MALAPGTRLGPYEIGAPIGAGGMGEVYRATDTNLGRDVAIKVLPDAFAQDQERLARFEREAKTVASLNHPNIAIIHGLEETDGVRALVMELVDGPTLADRIAQGPIRLDEALPIARQIAEALEAAHEHGIIHRDLKPANIKVREDGSVKVLDFGLAKALDPTSTAIDATQSPTITSPAMVTGVGALLGTAAYMSPEQARGKPADRRADIWAFGCVLYEMLSGRRAFAGDEVSDVLASVLAREPDWTLLPAGLSPVVAIYIKRCLHKDSKQRIGDMRDVHLALDGVFETSVSQGAQSAHFVQPLWRRVVPFAMTAVVAVLVTGLTGWNLWPSAQPQPVNRFTHALPPDQIFRLPGRSVMAVSRDGRHFVYNTVRGLYLRSMGALEARLIPGTEATLSNPFFSPDGQSVGFFRAGQLMRISIAGGVAVPICEVATPPFGASWERDDIILFAVPEGVMRVSARGGTPELVIPAKDGEQFDGPHLLPDGDSVLFSVTTAADAARWDAAQIVVQSLSGRQRTVVLQGGSDARYVSTGHLVYARGTTLFAVPFDISRLEVSGAPVSVVEALTRVGNPTQSSAAANYGVTEGGTLVSLRGGTQTFAGASGVTSLATLVWVDRRGHEEPLPEPPRSFVYPRLSPDGTQVALDVREQSLDIWVLDIRRQTMPRLTHSDAADVLPVWTPDGQRLVWTSNSDLYWQAADGTGTPEPLTKSSNYHRASSFTPDGQHLLLSEGAFIESAQDLVMISLKGDRRLIPLLQTKSSELNAEVSPNGRWVAYESDESGQFQIYVRPFPDVNQWKWTVSTNGGRQPLWARSGRELFYLAPDGTLMSSMVEAAQDHASFRTGLPARVMPNNGYYSAEGTVNFGRTYDVSPDGARFLRIKVKEGEASGGPRNFDVVLNWTEELKRLVPTK